jgi:hypothetical protein
VMFLLFLVFIFDLKWVLGSTSRARFRFAHSTYRRWHNHRIPQTAMAIHAVIFFVMFPTKTTHGRNFHFRHLTNLEVSDKLLVSC